MQIKNHWLVEARACPSPFFNERPNNELSLLVIHNIALPPLTYGGRAIEQLFTGSLPLDEHPYFEGLEGIKVSAHLLIRRTGELVQFVAFDKRAWHAGVSNYAGRVECNDFSVGIELEGSDNQPYTEKQYQQLTLVTKALIDHYPLLTKDRICGHDAIAPGRKTDPGSAFNWLSYQQSL
ncbi:1,6-anhydro-N-acetylmuramyl-L-alanine amidase AmpD [Marinospirillum insulare]|uniref:1,6-anhydro-N-acetylmuramyl-L-alanine amidase AmpD n=1 Tax=Marinospirillum insulare TaxID=217169 RepID=A0ABQ5ZVG2_9GAMM|nr:1,6-anhydro-N-acetylmuramyl-L-alanine amidase AmpD [Marinospirillum insulare]GLR63422.1 N-acetyl-anhydromuranmyl-L-alanine amidase [Marinospirillum insulare]